MPTQARKYWEVSIALVIPNPSVWKATPRMQTYSRGTGFQCAALSRTPVIGPGGDDLVGRVEGIPPSATDFERGVDRRRDQRHGG
jgi:hypothetical protein